MLVLSTFRSRDREDSTHDIETSGSSCAVCFIRRFQCKTKFGEKESFRFRELIEILGFVRCSGVRFDHTTAFEVVGQGRSFLHDLHELVQCFVIVREEYRMKLSSDVVGVECKVISDGWILLVVEERRGALFQ